jgi:putative heme-binding domain-containing protein
MQPYLYAVNLNGMTRKGDQQGMKILPLGAGDLDLSLLRTIRDSGYTGPIGILNHTDHDAEARLQDNLDGLAWLVRKLNGQPAGAKPKYRTWQSPPPAALEGGKVFDGQAAFRIPPITVECRATLRRKDTFNILVACDEKKSASHWEIFSMAGSGFLTAYLPGRRPDHVRSNISICDNRPHTISMILEASRVRLFLDGQQVADQKIESLGRKAMPGGLAIGRLVEGGLTCHGDIDWVRISKGVRKIPRVPPVQVKKDTATLKLWTFSKSADAHGTYLKGAGSSKMTPAPPYDAARVADSVAAANMHGIPERGVAVFAAAKFACMSCHKVGTHGGSVGPDLTTIGKQRTPTQIVESLFWPKREVKPEYVSVSVLTEDGKLHRGYKLKSDKQKLVLRDPATGKTTEIARDTIEEELPVGTLMPDGLIAGMSLEQQLDLIRFLMQLGRDDSISSDVVAAVLAHAHVHAPAKFPIDPKPLHPEHWPNWQHAVNRDRLYDYYTKQAEYFRKKQPVPMLLPEFPGMDGGKLGHWVNQNDETWASDRWNETQLGSVQSGIFRGAGVTVARGVCVRLGERGELSACFNPDTLTYDAVWSGGFVKFSSVRHGFMHGLILDGTLIPRPKTNSPDKPFVYRGFYRHGRRIVFSYRVGDTEYLDAPWVENGKFTRVVSPADNHPLKYLATPGKPQWPQQITTRIVRGVNRPYAVDTIGLPMVNPWKSLVYCGGHDFLPDGSALVCTMQGDVWRVSGLVAGDTPNIATAHWRRFASGLHHALGLVVAKDGIFVQCRDQLTRLQDLNQDGEADFYECFSNAFITSAAGHDFTCGLQRDDAGNFYTASGNQGLVRISADGRRADVIATGFRNPNGLGLHSDGLLTIPCSEGEWTPASMICAMRLQEVTTTSRFFGYRGPRNSQPPDLPLAYLPRGLDNSSGGQTYVNSDRWGPLTGQLIHFSSGAGAHFLVLRDEVDGQLQGAVVPLPGEFLSGVHRGRFNPRDGQLYVSGMAGWGNYTPDTGCFQRVRYTGDRVQLPSGFHVYQNGVAVSFTQPIDKSVAANVHSHFAQCWNYRYSGAYGSPEYSTRHPGTRGHDPLTIRSAHVLPDGRTLFLELPDLQPVNQLHLRLHTGHEVAHDLFVTVHRLDKPFTEFPGYRPVAKTIAAHPILSDIALATKRVLNPWRQPIVGARAVRLETGKNLTFATRSLRAQAGERIQLTLYNPDVVPHNWALVKPGTLQHVGELSNRLVADPEAFARHYIPQTNDVLFYTDVVPPQEEFAIHFRAPSVPGRYPYLCTFPGHWMIMNGELIVE